MPEGESPIDHEAPDAEAIARGYEARDIQSRVIYTLLGGVLTALLLLCAGLWWWHGQFDRTTFLDAPRSAVPATQASAGPPLQPQEGHVSLDAWDLKRMREGEDNIFAAFGWTIDPRTKRPGVPAAVLDQLRSRAATRPAEGGG